MIPLTTVWIAQTCPEGREDMVEAVDAEPVSSGDRVRLEVQVVSIVADENFRVLGTNVSDDEAAVSNVFVEDSAPVDADNGLGDAVATAVVERS